MTLHKSIVVSTVLILGISMLYSCRMRRSYQMNEQQQREMQASFDSLQENFDRLVTMYKTSGDTLPQELRNLYARMQDMHRQMEGAYTEMMGMHGRHMEGRGGMMGDRERHIQGHMTGEWYQQMMAMHEQMADFHNRLGQDSLARMNRRLTDRFDHMRRMIPGIDETPEISRNGDTGSTGVSGEMLYSQNCASCHGENGEGFAAVFPPVTDSEWVTGEKEVAVRILLHGLTGSIEVDGREYRGTMPSFKVRLSDSEVAAILTYLRNQSEGDLSPVTANDVAEVRKEYRDRSQPWNAGELRKE